MIRQVDFLGKVCGIINNSKLTKEKIREKYSRYHRCTEEKIEYLNIVGRKQLLQNWKNGLAGYHNTHKGRFKPKNPQKYKGDVNNIIYRSGYEIKFFNYLDKNSSILEWSSEEIVIPYISPIDNRYHRYFPDIWMKIKKTDGSTQILIIEIKPAAQTQEPEKRKRISKQYITEVMRWGVNEAKWKAATEYCLDRGWEFKILTEKDLGITYK